MRTMKLRSGCVCVVSAGVVFVLLALAACGDGLKDVRHYERGETQPPLAMVPDTRQVVPIEDAAGQEYRDVMLQHLETLDQIVAALAEGNYPLAQMQAQAHGAFFARRMQMIKQRFQEFPPNFRELAMAHQSATEALAESVSTKDVAKILPKLDGVLKACTACHRAFKVQTEKP